MSKKYNVGLALSGGGTKGIAHLGVLKALEERGIKIDIISGVSAGAIIGALYADGHSTEEIRSFLQKNTFFQMVRFNLPKNGGLASSEKLRKKLDQMLVAKTFEDLKIPLIINATELNSGKNVYFKSGNLVDCIIASASVPLFFNPMLIDGKQYVDGGIFCNLPASVLRNECNLLIGVHVNPTSPIKKTDGVLDVAERIFHLAVNGNTIEQKEFCDLVIETKRAKKFGMFDASKADLIYKIGYDYAVKAFDKFDFSQYGLVTK
ncbi:MAG: patatin-like phospholipase family protein [Paludibacteraceae bacterium]|nr:patatin-like phospholipase family protein [Paludibacteraceae bacterium]